MTIIRRLILFFLLSSNYPVFAGSFNYEVKPGAIDISELYLNSQSQQPGDDTIVI